MDHGKGKPAIWIGRDNLRDGTSPGSRSSFVKGGPNVRREFGEVLQPFVEKLVQAEQVRFEIAMNQEISESGHGAEASGESGIENAHGDQSVDGGRVVGRVAARAGREVGVATRIFSS